MAHLSEIVKCESPEADSLSVVVLKRSFMSLSCDLRCEIKQFQPFISDADVEFHSDSSPNATMACRPFVLTATLTHSASSDSHLKISEKLAITSDSPSIIDD
jgi:hypothetical protein